jgi:hypothetical protein
MLDTIAYPEFVPNQILTDRQLNQLRSHLEQQDRATRVRLTGTGVVCGLHARRVTSPAEAVQVIRGYGVASDGDFIELCDTTTYTHARPYVDPDLDPEGKLKYLPWRNPADPTDQLDIIELIAREVMEGDDPPEADAFTAATLDDALQNRVVVLYLEHLPVDLNSCLVTSCDNKGRNINVHVRALLVRKADLQQAAACPAPPAIHRVPRLHTRGVPQPASDAAAIAAAFGQIVTAAAPAVSASIKALFDGYAPFLNLPPMASADPLAGKLTGAQIAQYRYDALLDIAAAYNETAAAAYSLLTDCCPAGTFPRHLMLGVLDGSAGAGYRNEFTPAPARNVMEGRLEQVRDLFRRLDAMIFAIDLDAHPGPSSIRPSHAAAYPLGRRARPFYFPGAAMDLLWRPRPRCTVDPDWPWLHPNVAAGLDTDYAGHTLLRIEGHVGDTPTAAFNDIAARRDAGNAEFHLLRSYLDDGAEEERNARAQIRGLVETPPPVAEAWNAFAKWVVDGDTSFGPAVALADAQQGRVASLQKLTHHWIFLRDRRALHCDAGAVGHDYLQARSDLLCAVARARGIARRVRQDLMAIEDGALTGAGLEAMRSGAPFTLVDQLIAAVLASPAEWDTPDEIARRLPPGGLEEGAALRLALETGLGTLDALLSRLATLALPPRVSEFDYDLFAWCFREALAASRELWHFMRALGLPVPGAPFVGDNEGDAPLHAAESPAMAADWLGLHGCGLARFATVFASYEALRAGDLSLFRNLAAVDGLEHLAGVRPGGTFVLVCDTAGAGGRVIADFSLEGCLPCCCRFDAGPLCLPPLALPDVRVIALPTEDGGKSYVPRTVLIDVVGNDCDLNVPPEIKLTGAAERSDRGVVPQVDPDAGVIAYTTPENAMPGMVDRFWYRIEQAGRCSGAAIGQVVIVLGVEPAVEGAIEGFVWREDTGGRGDDAIVTIVETGRQLMTAGNGDFVFDAVRAGSYTLRATQDVMASDPTPVTVIGGRSTHVEIMLRRPQEQPTTGRIDIRVVDFTGGVLPGVAVRLTHTGTGTARGAVTNEAGLAVFLNLPPGEWVGSVSLAGFAPKSVGPLALAAGQTLTEQVALGLSPVPVVPIEGIEFVATDRNVNVLDARSTVRKTVSDRYAKYADAVGGVSDPTVLASDAYRTGTVFLGEKLTDPAITDEALSAEYKAAATALSGAARASTGDQQAAYQTTLKAISAAYMDRVALSNPKALSTAATREIEGTVTTLKRAGVAVADMQEMWNGEALKTATGAPSADAIVRLIQ